MSGSVPGSVTWDTKLFQYLQGERQGKLQLHIVLIHGSGSVVIRHGVTLTLLALRGAKPSVAQG